MSEGYTSLDVGLTKDYLDLETLFPKGGPKDITEEVNSRILPDMPKGRQVVDKQISIVGKVGTGKTGLMNAIAGMAIKKYGKDKINILYTDDLRVCLDKMDGRPIQLWFVDDATSNASSRAIFDQKELAAEYNRRRHIYMEKNPGKPGVIITVFGWQRWKELDPAFRDGNITFFKTGMAQKSERKLIEDFIGRFYTNILYEIWNLIDKGNNAIKSKTIVRISALDENKGGVGIYTHEFAGEDNMFLPELILSEKYFGKIEENREAVLDRLETKPEWEKRVMCYRLHVVKGMTQEEVAKLLGVRQGFVSESKKKVEAEIKKK